MLITMMSSVKRKQTNVSIEKKVEALKKLDIGENGTNAAMELS